MLIPLPPDSDRSHGRGRGGDHAGSSGTPAVASRSPMPPGSGLSVAALTLWCWVSVLSPSGSVAARTQDAGPQQCHDVLAVMHLGLPEVRYVGCETLPDRQGKPLRATYRVAGRDAARAERVFAKALGMPRLRRSCCQWDAPPHGFRGADGRQCIITMVSEETVARSRATWPGIRAFEIVIECYTDDV